MKYLGIPFTKHDVLGSAIIELEMTKVFGSEIRNIHTEDDLSRDYANFEMVSA